MSMSTRRSARLLSKPTTATTTTTRKVSSSTKPSKVTKPKPKVLAKKVLPPPSPPSLLHLSTSTANPLLQQAISPLRTRDGLAQAILHLKASDPKLGKFIDTVKEPCTVMLPRDTPEQSSYVSLCQSIIYQQLAGKAAAAILLRFLKQYGIRKKPQQPPILPTAADEIEEMEAPVTADDFIFPPASLVFSLDVDEMKSVGLGQRKAEYLQEVARQFHEGLLSDTALALMSDEEVSRALVTVRGIGQWTADMFLIFHLKRPNVLPTMDLAVRKAMCKHFSVPFGKKTPTHEQMVEMGSVWEPYRSVATWYMWKYTDTVTQK
ncbi:hypothetical protein LPJ66_001066 [Kickxella alabastrina]|uniref:Uncharacterized protein n=1 Tax=Kickxella alabastrina TaxID=61397 RepID=A0ACC1IUA6_9FUNG|nr:hypothetical protein LPJ66_001066 [Kickxella alabastrina]